MPNFEVQNQVNDERSLEVYKRNDMIQKARFSLSVQEQRAVLYAISKIKPDDIKEHFTLAIRHKRRIIEIAKMLIYVRGKNPEDRSRHNRIRKARLDPVCTKTIISIRAKLN